MINIENLTESSRLRMADIANIHGKQGLSNLSRATIRRLQKRGLFPQPRRFVGVRGAYYLWGEVQNALEKIAPSSKGAK